MYSSTSEAATSLSFQGPPPPRPARSDQPPGNDRFAALVNSNTTADTGSGRAPEPSASQRRSDDTSAAADSRRSRDTSTADQTARTDSGGRDAAATQRSDANANADASSNADASANADAAQRSRAKSDTSKTDDTKSIAKPSSNDSPAADSKANPANPAQQDGPGRTGCIRSPGRNRFRRSGNGSSDRAGSCRGCGRRHKDRGSDRG